MKLKAVDSVTWCFPDAVFGEENTSITLHIPRNSDDCFQIVTDIGVPDGGEEFSFSFEAQEGLGVSVSQLCPVGVKFNSSPKHHETRDYDSVKDFVTRRAPFEAFDRVRPVSDGRLLPGALAFFVRVDAAASAPVGERVFDISLRVGDRSGRVTVRAVVHPTVLSDAKDSPYSMNHWLFNAGETHSGNICLLHGVAPFGEEYYSLVEKHLDDLVDMRNNYFQLPTAIPVRDSDGRVTGFDFSQAARHARLALAHGFRVVFGGFVAHFVHWDEKDYFLLWDMKVNVESPEGERQLALYFEGVKRMIADEKLDGVYMQGLVDEPQVPNSDTYLRLCRKVRELLPGVGIIDPIETPYIEGACDVYCVKQAVYDKYKGEFDALMERGATLWFYSCGFPAGKWMNHVVDLPLSATRLELWMGVAYGMNGFLHWGYMDYSPMMDPLYDTNLPLKFRGQLRYFPAGNAAVVYASDGSVYQSLRAHNTRMSAAEAELLMRLKERDPDLAGSLILSLCTDFQTYTSDSALILDARRALLDALDAFEA